MINRLFETVDDKYVIKAEASNIMNKEALQVYTKHKLYTTEY